MKGEESARVVRGEYGKYIRMVNPLGVSINSF